MSPEALSADAESAGATRAGVFVAVVGPSGAGKDTLIARAAACLGTQSRVRFARRIVTRPADGASEDHDSLDEAAFRVAEAEGAFSLVWRAHGLRYALPRSVEADLREGRSVVANISRRSLEDAARRFGRLEIVEVTAEPRLLLQRIAARGRESEAEIARRLARRVPLQVPAATAGFLSIDNSGDVETAASLFVRHLAALARRS